MAHIQDRGKGVNAAHRWQARYRCDACKRHPGGGEHSKTFRRRLDADRWLAANKSAVDRGSWRDPDAGRVKLRDFADAWLAAQTFDESTRETVASRLNAHINPAFGDLELRAIKPSVVQAWLRGRQGALAPSYVRVLLANLSSLLGAAVEDGMIAANPCAARSVRAPAAPGRKVVPWTAERVLAVAGAHPQRWRGVPLTAAGAGLRQGEVFALAVEDVDFLGRMLHVVRQVKLLHGRPVFAPPKGGGTREVPLADVVAFEVAERLRLHPAREVTLPWRTLDGDPVTVRLVFTTREGGPLVRTYYNRHVWKPALVRAGVEPTRANGMHALRHHYASALLDGGVNIRALADYLGHADPGFTLRTYTHLMPASEDRARQAVDAAFGAPAESLRNEEGGRP